jgi:short-subunit dehydrogenase
MIAIITGASSGMGREFVLQLAQNYPEVGEYWLVARNQDRLFDIENLLPGKEVLLFSCDLTKKKGIRQIQEALAQKKPKIKFVVNAAGYGVIGDIQKMPVTESIGMVDLNCRALTAVTAMALPYMIYGGAVIQMASAAAFVPQPGFAVYAASKSYVLSYSRALEREVKHRGIRVLCVCPGAVKTSFFGRAEQYQHMKWYKKLVMAKPEAVVHQAIQDLQHEKSISVYGTVMKLFHLLSKVIPHKILVALIRP